MAIKIHSYFKSFSRRALLTLLISQAIVAYIVSYFIFYTGNGNFYFILITLIVASFVTTTLAFYIFSRPFAKLSRAVAHVSKDPVMTQPPKLSAADANSGLKDLVQTIYELSVASGTKAPAKTGRTPSFLEEIMQAMPCGIIVIKKNGEIGLTNRVAPVEETPEKTLRISLNFDQTNNLDTWLQDCRSNKVRDQHLWLRVSDKLPGESDQRIFDVAAYYQKEGSADIEAIIITFDRTSVYQLDQEDMDFIALAAHELRGPITVIRGYIDVLSQELGQAISSDHQELLERLEVSAEKLASYVNNILNVSRYDRHQFAIHPQEENLSQVVSLILPELMLRAKTQRRQLTINIAQDLPTIAADSNGLGEVLSNLVDNAIKYSPENGEIILAATTKDNQVEITVQDKGIGIPSAIAGNLFSRFYRSHRTSQGVGGIGLGLYICKAIVEMHGGRIWVRSVEGEGSTFGVVLPTYQSVADKLQKGDNINITRRAEGWIKNHAMVRR